MSVNISLDLETWGTRPGCDIRSIGAVVFDPMTGLVDVVKGTFYVATYNPFRYDGEDYGPDDEGRKYPLHRDPETVKWWSEQSPESQAAFANPIDLGDALLRFMGWFDELAYKEGIHTNDVKLWANDPHFDVSILEAAYFAVGLPVPWHYRAPRSMKTASDLAGLTPVKYGVEHHALDDAIAQAMTVCRCYERLGLAR